MTKVDEKLHKVHDNLWGPHHPASLSSKTYAAIFLNVNTRETWVVYLRSKDNFVDTFQNRLPKIQNKYGKSMKVLCVDGGGEFISSKLKNICNSKYITIKYIAPYMYEKNGLAEHRWKTVVTMKIFLLIDNSLPLEFRAEVIDSANYL